MVLKKMLSAFGVGGPTVDTVLDNPHCRPGETLHGQVHVTGGKTPAEIEYISLGLVARVETEQHDAEHDSAVEFHRLVVADGFTLAVGERRSIPFQFPVPLETPVTAMYGQPLHGMTMGVRTELSIARAVDKTDLDPVAVHPLPAQELILAAFGQLGFQFKGADLERGHLHGVHQQLPFYQEIEFYPPPHAHGINEIEVTFVAAAHGMDVILEVDKRSGMFTSGHDAYGHLRVDYATAEQTDWAGQIDGWLRGALANLPAGYGAPGHGVVRHGGFGGHQGYQHGYSAPKPGGHGRGMGAGGVVAGAAAGMVGGMVAGHLLGEVFDGDDDGGDDGGDFEE